MKLSRYEKETVILYNEAETEASVYTHNPKLKEKLKRLSKKYPDQITFQSSNCIGGMTYTVPKRCVLIREPYSEERRRAERERANTAKRKPPKRSGKTPDN